MQVAIRPALHVGHPRQQSQSEGADEIIINDKGIDYDGGPVDGEIDLTLESKDDVQKSRKRTREEMEAGEVFADQIADKTARKHRKVEDDNVSISAQDDDRSDIASFASDASYSRDNMLDTFSPTLPSNEETEEEEINRLERALAEDGDLPPPPPLGAAMPGIDDFTF